MSLDIFSVYGVEQREVCQHSSLCVWDSVGVSRTGKYYKLRELKCWVRKVGSQEVHNRNFWKVSTFYFFCESDRLYRWVFSTILKFSYEYKLCMQSSWFCSTSCCCWAIVMFGFELVTCPFIHFILAMDSKSDILIIAHLVSRFLGVFVCLFVF